MIHSFSTPFVVDTNVDCSVAYGGTGLMRYLTLKCSIKDSALVVKVRGLANDSIYYSKFIGSSEQLNCCLHKKYVIQRFHLSY